MAEIASHWSGLSDAAASVGRRDLLVLTATAAAALLVANDPRLHEALAPQTTMDPAEAVRAFPKFRWDWTVELAVLQRLDTDRTGALALLWAALELDLDPAATWRLKPALRLYDLYAAMSDFDNRSALAELVRQRTAHPALLARASLWSDRLRASGPRLWRTVGPDRQSLGIYLTQA